MANIRVQSQHVYNNLSFVNALPIFLIYYDASRGTSFFVVLRKL